MTTYKTKIMDYKGKAVVKLPRKVAKEMGVKVGDEYDISVNSEGQIVVQFLRK